MSEHLIENKHVLVVEDNVVNQMLLKKALAPVSVKITMVSTGEEGIMLLKTNLFDFVLLDIFLPGMDGYETIRIIREELKSDIPVIGMTASSIGDEQEKCIAAGMNGCLCKPFSLNQLAEALETILPHETKPAQKNYVLTEGELRIDLTFLNIIAADDQEYIQSMISTFLDNLPPVIQKMEQNLIDQDWLSLGKNAHYAKSSLSVIQISPTLELVQEIEQKGKNQTAVETLPEAVRMFKDQFQRAKDLLIRHNILIQ